MKRLFSMLLVLFVLLQIPIVVDAHDVPQERNDCSIELLVRYDGKDVDGGTLTAIKVGYVSEDDGNYFFCQEMTNVRLEDVTSADAPEELKEFYENNKENYDFYTQTQSVKSGKATFSGLETGLYLIVQNKAAKGYTKVSPFLVSVPYMKDGVYEYHVTAAIKSEVEREPDATVPPAKPSDPTLPQTGQMNWPIPLMATAGLALFVIGWLLCFGKKKELYEE